MMNMHGARAAGRCRSSFGSLWLLRAITQLLLVFASAATPAAASASSSFEEETKESSSTAARGPRYATVYRAEITEIPGTDSDVTGFAYVFASRERDNGSGTIGYAGQAMGLEPDLFAPTCTAVNGCGVHVHAGFSCQDAESQGGHYFESPVEDDPWVDDRYSSNSQGQAKFSGIVDIGNTNELAGRAFISKSLFA
jgi:hypothetical protein